MMNNDAIFDGPGIVRGLLREFDFASAGLDSPATWSTALKTVVELMLDSTIPVRVCLGERLNLVYNDAYIDFLEDRHPAALCRPYYEVWPEIRDKTKQLLDKVLGGQSICVNDLELNLVRGGVLQKAWFTYAFAPIRDESRKVLGVYGACIEHTQQRLLEARLADQNQRMERMFQQAPGFMAVMQGPYHVYEFVNDALCDLMGKRDYVGKPVREAVPELAGQGFFELLDEVYRTGKPFVGKGLPADLQVNPDVQPTRRYMNFVYQPIVEMDGSVSGIFVEGADVTDEYLAQIELKLVNEDLQGKLEQLQRTELALVESEHRFRTITNATPQMVWTALPDGTIDYHNQQFYDFVGLRAGDEPGKAWAETLVHPDDQKEAQKTWSRSVVSGSPYEITYRIRHHSGQYRWILARALPLRNDTGAIVKWMGTDTDIHDKKLIEEALRTANQHKDEFLAMLAHELRNPLAPISSAAQVLRFQADKPDKVKAIGDVISRQVLHMNTLMNDLLDVSRVTRGLVQLDCRHVDIKTVVTNAVEQVHPLIEERSHALELQLTPARATVLGDHVRLVQVIANLLTNAAKYTPTGGRIILTLMVSDEKVYITVQDNGTGLEATLLPRIFDLFTQDKRTLDRSQGGLGLGLALVKSIVEMHGGHVSAQSEGPRRGSTFTVELPVADSEGKSLPEQREEPLRRGLCRHVMIVDDNVDASTMLAILVNTAGHSTLTIHNPLLALEAALRQPPDIFILDIGMPELNGYSLCRRLQEREELSAATYIALSGYGQRNDRELARQAGFDHHLVKPVDVQKLLALLSSAN